MPRQREKQSLKKIRVLIVDDHTLIRDGICALLALVSDVEVVGEASNGKEALVMTQYDDSDCVIPVIEAGARGFITKMSAFSELSSAIQSVYSGESFLSPSAAMVLIEEQQRKKSDGGEEKDPYQGLTDREREVLKLIVENHTVREIADILFLSPKTVEWYKTKLMGKLNIHNKTDLIRFAIRKKIITL
jgi:two-component system response regulator NreC